MNAPNTVADIKLLETRGPWISKSGGKLDVLFSLPQAELEAFLDFDNPEFDKVPQNIRGLRTYTVSDIPKGSIGGKEWHRARTEYIGALAGAALMQCVDMHGQEEEYVLDGNTSIIMPPGILHTYIAQEDGTRLQVIANTLFVPEDPLTHDTFSAESFPRTLS